MNTNTRDSRRVVLPPYEGEILGPPLGLLGLVGALRQARYKADIVDGSLFGRFPPPSDRSHYRLPLLRGLLAYRPDDGRNRDRRIVKQVRPDIPVIYGGWHACNYCTDMVFYNRRFNAYTAEHVVTEPTSLVSSRRLTEIALVDSNFLVGVHRAVAIAEGTTDSGVRFLWTFQASTDLLCRMSDEEVASAASGVRHIGFGTEESASPKY